MESLMASASKGSSFIYSSWATGAGASGLTSDDCSAFLASSSEILIAFASSGSIEGSTPPYSANH